MTDFLMGLFGLALAAAMIGGIAFVWWWGPLERIEKWLKSWRD